MNLPDVDIDVKDRNEILRLFEGKFIEASMFHDGTFKKHPSGVFFQDVPIEPFTGLCAFPSGKKSEDVSEQFGLIKIDIINNYGYKNVKSYTHLNELLEKPIPWELFDDEKIVKQLQHIGNHYKLVYSYQPRSIEDIACLIALIRPAKKYLVGEEWPVIREKIWLKEGDEYAFKKSHAIGFALMIIVQLQALIE